MKLFMNGMEKFHLLGLQPNVERYMRDNNRQTIGKLGLQVLEKMNNAVLILQI